MKSPLMVRKQEVSKIEERTYTKFCIGEVQGAKCVTAKQYLIKQYMYEGEDNTELRLPSWVFEDKFNDLSKLAIYLMEHRILLELLVERYWK